MINKILGALVIFSFLAVSCSTKTSAPVSTIQEVRDLRNTSYMIDNEKINLIHGEARVSNGQGGANVFTYFGNEVVSDFNNDGINDTAFLLTKTTEGTGAFYYVVVALNSSGLAYGTNGVFVGDRIAPQTTEYRNGEIIVNYADRKGGEPMTAVPSVGVSRYFKISENSLVEVNHSNTK